MKWNNKMNSVVDQFPQELLLKTKLTIPSFPRTEYVSRQRLLNQCEQIEQKKVTICIAPAGYGKTTLMAEWAVRNRHPVAWVSLDKSDNNPVRFWAHVIAALSFIEDSMKQQALEKLLDPQLEMEAVLTLLLNAIHLYSQKFTLILDDYHAIDNPFIHQSFAFLIEHQPASMHICLISRTQPPLPLARLRAQNQLFEIYASDLQFTMPEVSSYLNQVSSERLSPCDLNLLMERTEGWITGIGLLVKSLKKENSCKGKREWKLNRYVISFFEDEVWAYLKKDEKQFLLSLSILDTLTLETCQWLTARQDSQSLLEQLYQEGMFVYALDEEQAEYRLHPLFQDFLNQKLQNEDLKRKKELHLKMVEWYEKKQLHSNMVNHAVLAEDYDQAVNIIKRYASAMLKDGAVSTIQQWLDQLPIERILSDPKLGFIQVWSHLTQANMIQAKEWLSRIEEQPTFMVIKQDKALWEEYQTLRLIVQLMSEEMDTYIPCALEKWKSLSFDFPFYPHLSLVLGEAFKQVHRLHEAIICLQAAVKRAQQHQGSRFIEIWAEALLAEIEISRGLLREAMARLNGTIKRIKTPLENIPIAGMLYLYKGIIHYEWDQLEEAEKNMTKAYELCRHWDNQNVLIDIYIWKARVVFAKQKRVVAKEFLKRAEELVENQGIFPQESTKVRALQAWLAILQEKETKAIAWAQESQLALDMPYPAYRDWEAKTRIRVMILEKDEERAIRTLKRWENHARQTQRKKELVELLVLKAKAYMHFGQAKKALQVMVEALEIGSQLRLFRTFLDEGPESALLILQLAIGMEKGTLKLSKPIKQEYLTYLLSLFKKHGIMPSKKLERNEEPFEWIEPLSEREKQVLQLVAEGMTNQEIADHLIISLSTVKKHINNIYGKLQVRNRTQAIYYARKLQLLNA